MFAAIRRTLSRASSCSAANTLLAATIMRHAQPTLGQPLPSSKQFSAEGGAMASLYTRAAERRRLALESMRMLANNHRTSIAAPSKKGAAENSEILKEMGP